MVEEKLEKLLNDLRLKERTSGTVQDIKKKICENPGEYVDTVYRLVSNLYDSVLTSKITDEDIIECILECDLSTETNIKLKKEDKSLMIIENVMLKKSMADIQKSLEKFNYEFGEL